MMEEGLHWTLYSLKLTTAVQWCLNLATVLVREDVEVCLHAAQTKAEHFWLCVWANFHLEKLHYCYKTSGL